VYLCTIDRNGDACSVIQSLYGGFGSRYVGGGTGILFQNRGHYFSLDPAAPNVIAPGKRTLHTLMASMAFDEDGLRHVFGSMGADGQPQFNVQVLHRLLGGASPAEAVAAPRILHGRFALADDPEMLRAEADYGDAAGELGAVQIPVHDSLMGHAHAITIAGDGSVSAGADPRSDGSAEVVPAAG
jgi:gamma-glutamyltranspeptidase/glutathione hydrolase